MLFETNKQNLTYLLCVYMPENHISRSILFNFTSFKNFSQFSLKTRLTLLKFPHFEEIKLYD